MSPPSYQTAPPRNVNSIFYTKLDKFQGCFVVNSRWYH
jgi:hypothetical protein